ncbi:MAG: hypothetical protein M0Q91_03995 [Methanoregula sp.]|jgi:uncharacterized membrane protein HdeD (DUF308 family)|nr:hypothetical protein [Methanoregula sp.]
MFRRWLLPVVVILLLTMPLSAGAHVPISAADNNALSSAVSVEKPTKSYVIYGHLHDAGDTGYYRLTLSRGDRLVVSLMTNGMDSPVPDLVVMNPDYHGANGKVPEGVTVPVGYSAEIISGKRPVKAEYEPFSPAAIFEVASYSKEITESGDYYVAVVSTADETRYSIATGYLEEFSVQEWVLVPVDIITARQWEGQSIIEVFAPFLGTIILGFFLIIRREGKREKRKTPSWFWFSSFAGLFYLGGASIILVQMIRALMITGFSGAAALTLVFFLIPVVLAVWLLRIAFFVTTRSSMDRISLAVAGVLGLVFWAGLIIGPVLSLLAALIPDRY